MRILEIKKGLSHHLPISLVSSLPRGRISPLLKFPEVREHFALPRQNFKSLPDNFSRHVTAMSDVCRVRQLISFRDLYFIYYTIYVLHYIFKDTLYKKLIFLEEFYKRNLHADMTVSKAHSCLKRHIYL